MLLSIDDRWLVTKDLKPGEVLFRQGDGVRALFFVESGQVRLERRTFDGRLTAMHTARAGEYFAEASLFADAYHCDAVALETSRVRLYPKQAVLDAISSDPVSATSFAAMLARQLQATRQRLELRDVRSAEERIMLYLALKAEPDGSRLALDGPLQNIAAELGLTREALYRGLAALEKQGAIRREQDCIIIRRHPGL